MGIMIAVALLAFLFTLAGKRNPSGNESNRQEIGTDWIDELEIIDAALDDYI